MKTTFPPIVAMGCAAGMLSLAPLDLPAATRVKANNSDALNLASSWTNAIVPGGADVAQFDAAITGPLSLTLGADTAWNQINFVNPAGEVTVGGGNLLTLSNNTPILFGTGAADLTLNCNVRFAGAGFASIRSPAAQTLAFGGVIDGRDVTVTLGNSAGTILLSNPNTVRIGSVVQVNTAGMRLGVGASSIGNPIASGPLGTNLFTWAASSATTEMFAFNGDQVLGNPVRLQFSPLNFNSANDLTFSDVVDFNNGNRVLNVAGSGVLRFTGTISNATGLTKVGPGVLELGGTNVSGWSSGMSIYGGTVRLLANNVIPGGASAGLVNMTNTAQALDMNGFSDTVRGLASPIGAGIWGGTLDNTAPQTTSVLTLGDDFGYTLAGAIQNSGFNAKLALVKVGAGDLILTNAHTFSGGITNASDSAVYLNSTGAAGTGPLVLASPNAELAYAGGGSTTWTNDVILTAGTAPVISAADGNVLEIAGVVSGPGTFMRTNALFQQGTLNISGDNTFSGGFVLFGGTVIFSHRHALGIGPLIVGNPTFAGGTIFLVPGNNLSGPNAIANEVLVERDFTVGGTNAIEFAGPTVWSTNAVQPSINVTNPAGIILSGPLSGYGFNKNGVGLLRLNGVCSHNGPSTISSGPLALGPVASFTGATTILVGGSASFDVSAVAGFAISPTQTLAVNGGSKVSGNVTVNGALVVNGVFNSATFSNDLTLAASSTATFSINRNIQTGTNLICRGSLAYGGTLIVNNNGGALLAGDVFRLFAFSTVHGSFAGFSLPALTGDLAWDTSHLAADGTLRVVSTAAQPGLTYPHLVNGTNFVVTAAGGTANGQFRILTQTNVAEPMTNWTILSTNTYDGSGTLTVTIPGALSEPQRFFRVVQP